MSRGAGQRLNGELLNLFLTEATPKFSEGNKEMPVSEHSSTSSRPTREKPA